MNQVASDLFPYLFKKTLQSVTPADFTVLVYGEFCERLLEFYNISSLQFSNSKKNLKTKHSFYNLFIGKTTLNLFNLWLSTFLGHSHGLLQKYCINVFDCRVLPRYFMYMVYVQYYLSKLNKKTKKVLNSATHLDPRHYRCVCINIHGRVV